MFMSSVDSKLRSKFPLEWTGEALHIAVEIKGKKNLMDVNRQQNAKPQHRPQ